MEIIIAFTAGGITGALLAWLLGRRGASDIDEVAEDAESTEMAVLQTKFETAEKQLSSLKADHQALDNALKLALEKKVELETEKRLLSEQISKQPEQLKTQFRVLANEILKENSDEFSKQSKK